MQDYQGKVVAITGAANGIGKELALRFGAAGARLALADIDADHLGALRKELEDYGVDVFESVFDVRHFDDMEELGLALVDESFESLHAMVRSARNDPNLITNAIDASVDTVVLATQRNKLHFRFIARERYGGVKRIRRAIRRELQLFADELAVDLSQFPFVREWPLDDRRMLASAIAETMIHMAAELLEAEASEAEEIIQRTRDQLLLINLGAPTWREMSANRARVNEVAREG